MSISILQSAAAYAFRKSSIASKYSSSVRWRGFRFTQETLLSATGSGRDKENLDARKQSLVFQGRCLRCVIICSKHSNFTVTHKWRNSTAFALKFSSAEGLGFVRPFYCDCRCYFRTNRPLCANIACYIIGIRVIKIIDRL